MWPSHAEQPGSASQGGDPLLPCPPSGLEPEQERREGAGKAMSLFPPTAERLCHPPHSPTSF